MSGFSSSRSARRAPKRRPLPRMARGRGILQAPARAATLLRTLRYVPPGMLAARLGYKARCVYYRTPFWGLSDIWRSAPVQVETLFADDLLMRPPLLDKGDAAVGRMIAAGQWPLVGITLPRRMRDDGTMDWRPGRVSALWVFHLHYFDWLADLRAAQERTAAQELVSDWLNQYSRWDPVAWHPYPLSVRMTAWLTHADWLLDGMGPEDREAFFSSLRMQAAYLARNVEHWLGGNHVVKNLRALITAGCCLPGAGHHLTPALAELLRQVAAQVREDGGHFERSPWYQAQVLGDLVAVQNLLKKKGGAPEVLVQAVRRMGVALAFYRHLDGGLALMNDGAVGDAAALERLLGLAGVDGVEPPIQLPATGFARLERGPMLAVCDVGAPGPAENPGHAHAQVLSFELSVRPEGGLPARVLVNGGTFAYQDPMRNIFRGTAAHCTVSVDGEDSAEVWGSFRVGRRPEEVEAELKDTPGSDVVLSAWHDGYRHRGVLHRRQWLMAADGSRLRGADELIHDGFRLRSGSKPRIVGHFPVHPEVSVTLLDDRTARLTLPERPGHARKTLMFRLLDGGRLTCKDGWYAPRFGEKTPMTVLTAIVQPGATRSVLNWEIALG